MNQEVAEQLTLRASEELRVEPCDFFHVVHRFLTDLARQSGMLEAIGLRAAAGAVTKLRRKAGC